LGPDGSETPKDQREEQPLDGSQNGSLNATDAHDDEVSSVANRLNPKTDSWLIKSGDMILGPFTAQIVSQKLLARELVIIDEISLPMGRWRLIRDEPTFAVVVEESRRQVMNNREETEVGGYTSPPPVNHAVENKTDQTATPASQAPPAMPTSSQSSPSSTASLASNTMIGRSVAPIQDAEYTESTTSSSADDSPQTEYKQFGARDFGRKRAKPSQSVIMWIVAALVVIGAAVMIMNMKKPASERVGSTLDFDKAVASAERVWQRGDFQNAEKLYSQANRLRPLKLEVVTRLAPLMIQLDGQTVEAKRLLADTRNAMATSTNPRLTTELQLGSALAAMFSMEYPEAESLLQVALQNSRGDVNASFISEFNLGMLSFIGGQYEEASRRFTNAGDAPIAMFMKVRALASLPKKRGGRKEAAALLLNLTKNHFDFYQEAQLLSAALLMESGNKKGALNRVRLVLDADPEMTASHWHDPLLFQSAASWKALTGVCRRLHDGLKSSATRALLSLCLGKAGQTEDAMRTLNEGLASNGEDALLQSVNAQLLYNSNRDDDARAALRMALRQEPVPVLGRMVKARLCMRRNEYACAEEEWKFLSNAGTQRLTAFAGLAQIYALQKNTTGADDLVGKALGLSSRYRPALRLRDGVAN
jgi:tetratricopeptide (TPR) repeat protein